MAEQLIKCELLNGRALPIMYCKKCGEIIYEPNHGYDDPYLWCPLCSAVFNSKRILTEDEIESLFPKVVKELCVSAKSHLQKLQILARKENHSEEIEGFMQEVFERHKKRFKKSAVSQVKKQL